MKTTLATFFYSLSATFGAFCSYFNLEPLIIGLLVVCFILDTALGTYSAKKQKTYLSRKGEIMVFTKLIGFTLIFIIGAAFKLISLPHEYFVFSALMVLAFHDIISILRHTYYFRTGEALPEFDAVSALIKSMHNKLRKVVDKLLNFENYDKTKENE